MKKDENNSVILVYDHSFFVVILKCWIQIKHMININKKNFISWYDLQTTTLEMWGEILNKCNDISHWKTHCDISILQLKILLPKKQTCGYQL